MCQRQDTSHDSEMKSTWDKLYSQGKDKKVRRDKTGEEVEIERNIHEFTFKPAINQALPPRQDSSLWKISHGALIQSKPGKKLKKKNYIDKAYGGKKLRAQDFQMI